MYDGLDSRVIRNHGETALEVVSPPPWKLERGWRYAEQHRR